MNVITRFAPSPTGKLHFGGLRIALINWLAARKEGGQFILRIEDTDIERSQDQYTSNIIERLKWVGLDYDSCIKQSDNLQRYMEVAKQLVKSGKAYFCTCDAMPKTPESNLNDKKGGKYKNKSLGMNSVHRYNRKCRGNTIEPKDKYVIRIDSGDALSIKFKDLVFGEVPVTRDNLDDFIIIRSNGLPTYSFAVVVDDHDCGITIVSRGADHLVNTGKQLLIYDACNWSLPQFAHIPLMLSEDGRKMSKRQSSFSLDDCRLQGLMPEALLSYAYGLSFGFEFGREVPSLDNMIKTFDWKRIGFSPTKFDNARLLHLNQSVMMKMTVEDAKESFLIFDDNVAASEFWNVWRGRASTIVDYLKQTSCVRQIFNHGLSEEYLRKIDFRISYEEIDVLNDAINQIRCIEFLTATELITQLKNKHINVRVLLPLLRRIVFGENSSSPPISEIMIAFGKDKILNLLEITNMFARNFKLKHID